MSQPYRLHTVYQACLRFLTAFPEVNNKIFCYINQFVFPVLHVAATEDEMLQMNLIIVS